MKRLPYSRQVISEEDIAEVSRVLRSDLLTTGPEVEAFEEALAQYCGAKHAVVCSNGTTALHLAMMALGLGKNALTVTTPNTFLATANSVLYTEGKVHLVDIELENYNIDLDQLEQFIIERASSTDPVRVVIPVHFAGTPVSLNRLKNLSEKYGFSIIEDAAHAIGAHWQKGETKIKVGSCYYSDMTTFSFHPVKGMTSGEGGAIMTNSDTLYQRLLTLRNHGMIKDPSIWRRPDLGIDRSGEKNPWYYEMQTLGFNFRLTDIQCALGRSQLKRLDNFIKKRHEILAEYQNAFARYRTKNIAFPKDLFNSESSPLYSAVHLFPVRINFEENQVSRSEIMKSLSKLQIFPQVHYIPLHYQPYYAGKQVSWGSLPHAEKYYQECLSLPVFVGMDASDVDFVVSSLTSVLEGH